MTRRPRHSRFPLAPPRPQCRCRPGRETLQRPRLRRDVRREDARAGQPGPDPARMHRVRRAGGGRGRESDPADDYLSKMQDMSPRTRQVVLPSLSRQGKCCGDRKKEAVTISVWCSGLCIGDGAWDGEQDLGAPYVYRQSHILPSMSDPRGGHVRSRLGPVVPDSGRLRRRSGGRHLLAVPAGLPAVRTDDRRQVGWRTRSCLIWRRSTR